MVQMFCLQGESFIFEIIFWIWNTNFMATGPHGVGRANPLMTAFRKHYHAD